MGSRDLVSTPGIERLSAVDAPKNVALSRSVGWKDVESDWHVLHAAAEVLGVRQDEHLLVQGAYGTCRRWPKWWPPVTRSGGVGAAACWRRRLGVDV